MILFVLDLRQGSHFAQNFLAILEGKVEQSGQVITLQGEMQSSMGSNEAIGQTSDLGLEETCRKHACVCLVTIFQGAHV